MMSDIERQAALANANADWQAAEPAKHRQLVDFDDKQSIEEKETRNKRRDPKWKLFMADCWLSIRDVVHVTGTSGIHYRGWEFRENAYDPIDEVEFLRHSKCRVSEPARHIADAEVEASDGFPVLRTPGYRESVGAWTPRYSRPDPRNPKEVEKRVKLGNQADAETADRARSEFTTAFLESRDRATETPFSIDLYRPQLTQSELLQIDDAVAECRAKLYQRVRTIKHPNELYGGSDEFHIQINGEFEAFAREAVSIHCKVLRQNSASGEDWQAWVERRVLVDVLSIWARAGADHWCMPYPALYMPTGLEHLKGVISGAIRRETEAEATGTPLNWANWSRQDRWKHCLFELRIKPADLLRRINLSTDVPVTREALKRWLNLNVGDDSIITRRIEDGLTRVLAGRNQKSLAVAS